MANVSQRAERGASDISKRFESPLHDEWVASVLGLCLGVAFAICFVTGLIDYLAQHPPSWFHLPNHPVNFYRVTEGTHILTGIATIPLLLAKVWSVWPKLFSWPPVRDAPQALERLSLIPLVGGSLFLLFTGVANIDYWYSSMPFSFTTAHFWTAWMVVGALVIHITAKWVVAADALRRGSGGEPALPQRGATAIVSPQPRGVVVAETSGGDRVVTPVDQDNEGLPAPGEDDPELAAIGEPEPAVATTEDPEQAGVTGKRPEPVVVAEDSPEPVAVEPDPEPVVVAEDSPEPAAVEPDPEPVVDAEDGLGIVVDEESPADPADDESPALGGGRAGPEPPVDDGDVPVPARAGLSRRGFVGAVLAAAGVLVVTVAGETIAPLRRLALLAPRNPAVGPQSLPVNQTAIEAGVTRKAIDPGYRLSVTGNCQRPLTFSLSDLQALSQRQASLPITCVEGWSADAEWQGISLRLLLGLVGAPVNAPVRVESLESANRLYASSVIDPELAANPDTLLALELNGEPLDLDHGYPVRLIAPDRPGVLQTKWVHKVVVL